MGLKTKTIVVYRTTSLLALQWCHKEWIQTNEFRYYDHKVEKIAFSPTFGAKIADLAERKGIEGRRAS